jgi:quercetin dioxygenase-like cupin family protein
MTITRRDALTSVALFSGLIAASQPAGAQAPAPAPIKFDLPDVDLDGWEVTISHVPYPPGRTGNVHHHAGFVLAYVLQGAIVTQVSGQGPEKTYRPGEMFYEPPGSTHLVSRNASATERAELLAMIFAPKGATLTTAGPA